MTKWHRYSHCEARSAEAISSGNIVARPSNFVKILHIYHSKRVQEIAIRDTRTQLYAHLVTIAITVPNSIRFHIGFLRLASPMVAVGRNPRQAIWKSEGIHRAQDDPCPFLSQARQSRPG